MRPSRHNDIGPVVQQIQTALNFAGPTRLPRLPIDATFGPLTVGRVMEFQFRNGLRDDGIVGAITNAKLPQMVRVITNNLSLPAAAASWLTYLIANSPRTKTGMWRCTSARSQVDGPDFCPLPVYSQ